MSCSSTGSRCSTTRGGCWPGRTSKNRSPTCGPRVPRTPTRAVSRRTIHAEFVNCCDEHAQVGGLFSLDSLSASTTGLNPRICSRGAGELSTVAHMDVPEDLLYTSDHEW